MELWWGHVEAALCARDSVKPAAGPRHSCTGNWDLGLFLSFYQHSFSCLRSFKGSPWPLSVSILHTSLHQLFPFYPPTLLQLFFPSLYSPVSSWILHPPIQKTEGLGCALVPHMGLQGTLTFVSLIHCLQHGNKKAPYALSCWFTQVSISTEMKLLFNSNKSSSPS